MTNYDKTRFLTLACVGEYDNYQGKPVLGGGCAGGPYYAMHLVEAAYGVEFPAVFKGIPRIERWQLGGGAVGLDSLGTRLIWLHKYAGTCDQGPRGQPRQPGK